MKRSAPIERRTPLSRKTKLSKLNRRRAGAKRDRYAAFLRSPEWKALRRQVAARSGGRCERTWHFTGVNYLGYEDTTTIRCPSKAIDVHHVRYTKIRPNASLDDLRHLCRECHEAEEAKSPWRASKRLALKQRGEG
jgi:hypothetical protein